MFNFSNSEDQDIANKSTDDFLSALEISPEEFIKIEKKILHKPEDEILKEIEVGQRILRLDLENKFNESQEIVIIPPKYEFWTYILLGLKLAFSGNKVYFLYHNWAKNLVDLIIPKLNYLKYHNFSLETLENFDFSKTNKAIILNISETFNSFPNNIPSFSTAVITKGTDLDYIMGYIFEHTFSFGGLKKSNLKRIIVDSSIKEEFLEKLLIRIDSFPKNNDAKIKSEKIGNELEEMVLEAIADGANPLLGLENIDKEGEKNIILDDVVKDSRAYQRNFFGPILMISYVDFKTTDLRSYIKQQPSRGIVIFSSDNEFISSQVKIFRDVETVIRPGIYKNDEYGFIFEENPMLEKVFKYLGIN